MNIEMIDEVKCPHCGYITHIGGLVGPHTNDCPKCGRPALPTVSAPQPTQGVFMDNFKAPNLIGIIMQALEQHIEAMVDKRFNERMADFEMPSMDDVKNALHDMLQEKMDEHTSEYDHDEYDETVRIVDDAELDDLEVKITDVLRTLPITLNID